MPLDTMRWPPWAAIASYSTNRLVLSTNKVFSLTNGTLDYIPASLILDVSAVDTACQSNYWINIDAVVNGATTTVGRVAYLIANCSGLLDANYNGSLSPRASGTDPAEIEIAHLPELAGG